MPCRQLHYLDDLYLLWLGTGTVLSLICLPKSMHGLSFPNSANSSADTRVSLSYNFSWENAVAITHHRQNRGCELPPTN